LIATAWRWLEKLRRRLLSSIGERIGSFVNIIARITQRLPGNIRRIDWQGGQHVGV
jgi:hypothetical protein